MSTPFGIREGQIWAFINRHGKRTLYRIESMESEADIGMAAICKLVNVETGGIGWVTTWWIRKVQESDLRGHFEFVSEVENVEPVAA